MIPTAFLQAWSTNAPWLDLRQVEQDLIICRALRDLFTAPAWQGRYRSIVEHESHLHRNGTRIVKFFLHLSRDEQRKRFLARIDEPEKNWKFSLADIEERGFWAQHMHAYEACLGATSTKTAPWYVVPADDKENARLIISGIIVDTLKSLQMRYPEADKGRRLELEAIRKRLAGEDPSSASRMGAGLPEVQP